MTGTVATTPDRADARPTPARPTPARPTPSRPTPSDVALTLIALLLSGTVAVDSTAAQPTLLITALVVSQASSILLVRARPAIALLVLATATAGQFTLETQAVGIEWLIVAYLLLRNRAHRAVPLLAGALLAASLASGVGWASVVDPGGPREALGFGAGLLVVSVAPVAVAAVLGWTVRTSREQAVARREARAVRQRVEAVTAERARIGDEINGLVVASLHRLVERTEGLRARLADPPPGPANAWDGVAAEARRALTAMRRGLVLLRADGPNPAEPVESDDGGGRIPRPTPGGLALTVVLATMILLADALVVGRTGIPEFDRLLPFLRIQEDRPLTLPLLAVQLGALGWWRSAPLAAFAVGTLGAVGSGLNQSSHLVTEYSWMILVYGVAAGAPALASAVSVLVGTLAVLAVIVVAPRIEFTAAESVGGFLLVVPLWAVGALRRRSRRRAEREAADRAADRTRAAVDDERHRIARELHDVVAHHVSAIAVNAGAARTPGVEAEVIDAAVGVVEDYGRRTRDALPALVEPAPPSHPVSLTEDGVRELVEPVRAAGLPVSVRVSGDAGRLQGDAELFAHRILVEALTNVLRHAGPTPTDVTVAHEDDAVTVAIVDRGPVPGHRPAVAGSGLGLIGMRERTELLDGVLRAGPRGNTAGWSVHARLPRESGRLLLQEEDGPAGSSRAPTRQPDPAT